MFSEMLLIERLNTLIKNRQIIINGVNLKQTLNVSVTDIIKRNVVIAEVELMSNLICEIMDDNFQE